MSDPQAQQEIITPEQRQIRTLANEVEMLTNAGVIECMVRNKAVAEYIANLEAERDALKVDAERLNFLDGNLKFSMGWQVNKAPVGNVGVHSIIFAGRPPVTIREAIDAAIKEQA